MFKKNILPILLAGIWINIFETIRWELIIKTFWIEQYTNLGLTFPQGLKNNITWMIWGFLFAAIIFVLLKKFTAIQTALIAWFTMFVMMWLVIWNIGILPVGLLWSNAPLSLVEAYIAALICKRFAKNIRGNS